ncbi:hypothetical protein K450DRAFT_240072 [Umbelopsis ramanniana AG]|uniref:Peroxisomal ATPase PEX6 n=1 Tax=Umbelopsis ramanniana AG TaxID=1314678 RepID=A0AAD5HEU5_UMBRA|nr:uncharacterized protein K450DRAFT_240072 [Umbelopsis ramanniana AG]KAI8579991.1 hypothetical protein K450DRAFT_240072 [Umbelopsis ramanniana AG]
MPPILAELHATSVAQQQYVDVSPSLWKKLQGHHDTSPLAVSITFLQLNLDDPIKKDAKHRYLPKSIVVYARLSQQDLGRDTVSLHPSFITSVYGPQQISTELEEQLELDLLDEGIAADDHQYFVHIAPTNLIECDEVILGALDKKSYDFIAEKPDGLAELLKSGEEPPKIIRSSTIVTFNEDLRYKVLMSNPVLQGKIISTARTKVIVVDISASGDSEEEVDVSADDDATDPLSFSMLKDKKDGPQVIESQAFQPAILTTPWPDHQLVPNPPSDDDNECRVYVHVEDLARCGVFSSDWVLVSGGNHKRSRLCRIYGVDMDTYDGVRSNSVAYVSPQLYFNLGLSLPPSSIDSSNLYITRLAKPVTEGPPVAKALTVSRVASVVSVDKLLQNALLDALKQWFEERTRIVCEGDILAVSLDEDPARLLPQGRDMDDFSHLSLPIPSKPTAIAYFKITHLEEDERKQDDPHPAYFGAGRKISTNYTHMVQTGLECSRVPIGEISRYYGLTRKLPKCQTDIPAYNQIFNLLSSSLHPLAKDLNLSCTVLVQGPRGGGKSTVVKWVAEHVGVHVFEINAFDIVGETDAKTEVYLRAKFEKAMVMSPCVILLRGIEGLARKSAVVETGQEPLISTVLQDCIQNITNAHSVTGYPVMLVATTSDVDNLPTSILGCFRHELVIEAPAEAIRLQMLESLTEKSPLAPDVSLQSLATQTAALVSKDLVDLVGRSGVIAMNRVHKALETNQSDFVTDRDVEYAGVALTAHDFDAALNQARASYSDSIGAPKIPNVTWDDVGGLANVKDDILDTIQLPLEHPELFGAGMKKRSGILLYGPPGTGKTLLAKAIATSCSLNFFSVKGPELLNMYIGESEANVRRVFQRARDAKPCVIFFDELDSVAPKRGEKGDSGGVMDRIVSQLLAELDGMSEGESGAGDVFVIGATNRPDLLDPALLRPGRFDKLLYLGVSQDHQQQLKIIEALTRKFRLHPDLDLARVAEQCPFHYTGADFYALCSDAMLKAMTRVAEGIEQKVEEYNASGDHEPATITAQYYLAHMATPEDIVVQVTEPDFVRALQELIPSVSATELEHYKTVRARFEKKEEETAVEEPVHEAKPAPNKGKGKGKARVQ